MPNDKNIVRFKLEGIGPFADKVEFGFDGGTHKDIRLGIYATNGTGKTFISRCFNEFAAPKAGEERYYPKANLISFGKAAGKFELEVKIKDGASSKFSMPIDNADSPISYSSDEVIYHVFNSDYVKRQFMARDYIPDGNISGEIVVGEENAKTTTLTEEIAVKHTENDGIQASLTATINYAKETIKAGYDIRANLTAWQGITFDNIIRGEVLACGKSKDALIAEYEALKSFAGIADSFNEVPTLALVNQTIDAKAIDEELNKSYTRKTIQENFLEKIKSNQGFIRQGLSLTKDGKCPYCEQPLDNAKELIGAYNDFFDATQEEVSRRLTGYKSQFESLESSLSALVSSSVKCVKQFNDLKGYFPSTKDIAISPIVLPEGLADTIALCKNAIQSKITDISQTELDVSTPFALVLQGLTAVNSQIAVFNAEIKKVNTAKASSTEELKNIKNGLCNATFNDIIALNKTDIDKYNANRARIKVATEELQTLQAKKPCKELVYTTFCGLIKMYFGDKYSVEEDTFKLKLNAQSIDKPVLVLSDGEKSIVAFCYYLANTHSKISDKADYDRLVFVIDDPISSMDFNYVYETANVIKNLDKIIDGKKPKFIILTHNAEFMNILCGNKLLSRPYRLKAGEQEIAVLKHAFVAPYQSHLEDIHRIAEGTEKPCHTTYNSMRHILESIMAFVDPTSNELDAFIETQKVGDKTLFEDNGHIKRVIQDMSHGRPRTYEEVHEDKTIEGCKELVAYINDRFPGQVPHIQSRTT